MILSGWKAKRDGDHDMMRPMDGACFFLSQSHGRLKYIYISKKSLGARASLTVFPHLTGIHFSEKVNLELNSGSVPTGS